MTNLTDTDRFLRCWFVFCFFFDPTALITTNTGQKQTHRYSVHADAEVLSKFQNKSSIALFKSESRLD